MWECGWFLGASKFCLVFVAEHVDGCLSCPDFVECPAAVLDVGVSFFVREHVRLGVGARAGARAAARVRASGENCCWRLVETFKKFMMFFGLTLDDYPSPGMRLLAIETELVNQIKFYCNDSTIQSLTFRAKNMPLSREN